MAKIYTKTGDSGETGLFDGTRVAKYAPRVEAYGEVDELNAVLGLTLAFIQEDVNLRVSECGLRSEGLIDDAARGRAHLCECGHSYFSLVSLRGPRLVG